MTGPVIYPSPRHGIKFDYWVKHKLDDVASNICQALQRGAGIVVARIARVIVPDAHTPTQFHVGRVHIGALSKSLTSARTRVDTRVVTRALPTALCLR